MLLEFISHLLSFDLVWIVEFILANLHWLFVFFMFVIIAHNGKRPIWNFLVIVGLLWAIVDIEHSLSLIFVSLLIWVPLDWAVRIFLENTPMEKYELKIIVFLFLLLSFINTFWFNISGAL